MLFINDEHSIENLFYTVESYALVETTIDRLQKYKYNQNSVVSILAFWNVRLLGWGQKFEELADWFDLLAKPLVSESNL